jgi:HlyD family secretion protein
MSETDRRPPGLRKAVWTGYLALAAFAGAFALWSVLLPIRGAVIAPGQFVAETNVKKVQHLQGGIVAELLVREGQPVAEGDLLIRLDATQARAMLGIFSRQIDEFTVRAARLEAEREERAVMSPPAALAARADDADFRRMYAEEVRLFEARASARANTRALLASRVDQLRSEIEGLTLQREAKEREAAIIRHELAGVQSLFDKNLVQLTRLSQLQREEASLSGQRGLLTAQIAQAEGKIAEVRQQTIQIGEDLRSEALRELREVQARLGELQERRVAAEDQLKRIDIRAPARGIVHQLAVHTVGGVAAPGEALMLIVPSEELLHLEARVAPADYDQLHTGQEARVRLHAFNQRLTPELAGTVTRMSADITREAQTGQMYYTVRVTVPASELERIAPLRLMAGMQADVHVSTTERTVMSFLVRPLLDQFARTFRER